MQSPDFKQALSILQRLQQEAVEEPHVPTYSYKHKQWIGKVPGGLLTIQKVKEEASQVLSERRDPFLAVFGENLRKWLSRIQFIFYRCIEYFHYRQNWWISLNKSGNTTETMRKSSDSNQALSTLIRLHREAGGKQTNSGPRPTERTQQWKPTSSFFLHLVAM